MSQNTSQPQTAASPPSDDGLPDDTWPDDAWPDDALDDATLEAAVARHDRIAAGPLPVWLGAEPTFTDRRSEAPEWLSEALGPDKRARARRMVQLLAQRHPGAAVLRPLGRQYPGESEPRWCYGLYARRDGKPVWSGPPDRLSDSEPPETPAPETPAPKTPAPGTPAEDIRKALHDRLLSNLRAAGWSAEPIAMERAMEPGAPLRMICRSDGEPVGSDPTAEPRLLRPSIHGNFVEDGTPTDALAADGQYLVLLHTGAGGAQANQVWLELPGFGKVAEFLQFMGALAEASATAEVQSMGLRGFGPPVDDTIAWTTLTPDPAVLEVNQAPQATMTAFHAESRALFELATEVGLSPFRLHYNGAVSDSGGGGQITFGGPSPAHSPFFLSPQLLPRLIRYIVRHPALSYWFATQYVGGSSQSPRPDEGVREALLELGVALEQLAQLQRPTPEILWGSLRHFLADASGNPHRSELNVEKLHNPYLPGRGKLGLVEFRAFAMAKRLDLSTARAILLRSIVVMLQRADVATELVAWGDALHDRFALPFFLRKDLGEVLSDLRTAELGLGEAIESRLLARDDGVLAELDFAGVHVRIEEALEFWPLVGDVAQQGDRGSRLVDASTARIQIHLSPTAAKDPAGDPAEVDVAINGCALPLRTETDTLGAARLLGVRYRSFVPRSGMHPAMPAERNLVIELRHGSQQALRLTLYPWRPDGEAYPGLPHHLAEAHARRLARAVAEQFDGASLVAPRTPPARAVTPYCLDLRRVSPLQPV